MERRTPNRVTPFGSIEGARWRGAFMGNRGRLTYENGPTWITKSWITCTLEGRAVEYRPDRRYTKLFFSDEATALAAGHRPCAQCRREAYGRFRDAFRESHGLGRCLAPEIDHALRGSRSRPISALAALPDGAFIARSSAPNLPCLVWRGALHPWVDGNYRNPERGEPAEQVAVITPAPTVRVLSAGYVPFVRLPC